MAELNCPFGDGAHTNLPGIAEAGGGLAAPNGRTLEVSPMVDGIYTVGTSNRKQTWTKDGRKLTPVEVRRRQRQLASTETQSEPGEESIAADRKAPRTAGAGRSTNPKDFELAGGSNDPGILAQLAQSPDWNVRLLVVRNPSTATDTLEGLAVSSEKHAHLYRNAAHAELGHRYQDMRDKAELEACARMEADGALQKRLETMPNYRQLAYMPAERWEQKSTRARKTLLEAAMGEAAKLLKLTVKLAGWTGKKTAKAVLGKDGVKAFQLPHRMIYRPTREVVGFMVDFFTALSGDPRAQKGIARRLGFGW
ncbi:hypothetical protein [Microbacterium sp. SORGH_AS_0421]|uniref:hypothetical protein n=1 Tax=Microbacterium sp. SORGH_AS_0421 TaxID=3041768 RepID=UPI0027D7D902|nr:hypothetical protein [Microbacterium sp. SORGH_AS_0421]